MVPARRAVHLYDQAHVSLLRARRAVLAGNVEERVAAVGSACDALTELLGTLNLEQGGEIADNLRSLYAFALSELSDVARRRDGARLDVVIGIVGELRGAFSAMADDAAHRPAA